MRGRAWFVLGMGVGALLVNPLVIDAVTSGWYWNHYVSRLDQ